MKYYKIILLIFLFSCRLDNQKVQNSDYTLPNDKGINFHYTTHDECRTYYFFATDTTKPILSRIIGYDEKGNEKEVVYHFYESYVPATSIVFYDSSGRTSERYYRIDEKPGFGSLSKTLYEYGEGDRLIKSISFGFEKRIRKDVDKGLGRPGGCIITEEDYEKNKSWEISSVWIYKYDEAGKLIEKLAPIINSTQNRYTYKYDEKGRLSEERSLENERLIWIESYTYNDGGYEYTRTWYENGQRSKDYNGKFEPIDTIRHRIDKFGNETDEQTIEEGGRQISRHKKYYDDKNRIIRNEIYDENDKLLGFYIHKYDIKSNHVTKKFIVSNN